MEYGNSYTPMSMPAGGMVQRQQRPMRPSAGAMPTARISPLEDVQAVDHATRQWMLVVTSGRPDACDLTCALYAKDAVLWGTVSDEIRTNTNDIEAYFEYFANLQNLRVVGGSYRPTVQVLGDVAISSGYYTFAYDKVAEDGSTSTNIVPARYTFVYRRLAQPKNGVTWEIVNHHSSPIPTSPKTLKKVLWATSIADMSKIYQASM